MIIKMVKTNAMRLLSAAGITFETREYTVDENDLSGVHVAEQLGQPCEQVFKTLVLKGDKTGHLVCCIPVNKELDLKKVSKAAGDKKAEMIPMKDLLSVTGYIRGGCSPIGMKKKFPTYIDETCILFDTLAVSAGIRGAQIIIKPDDLISYTEAVVCELTK
jgi:Cys-tRNA(Pro)/Cys-tRNA(Cys) deacylase